LFRTGAVVTNDDEGRREHPRIEASFKVTYATIDQLVVAYTTDLSRGGMFLATQRFLPVNAVIRLDLELPSDAGKVSVICRVAYVREAARDDKAAGMGVEFLDLSGERLDHLERLIAGASGGPPTERRLAASPPRKLDMVVVDDEPLSLGKLTRTFEADGSTVRAANDGLEALAVCLKRPPDLLLTDVEMPRMDGWQLLRMVRARPTLRSVVVIFLTTLDGEENRLKGYQLGVDDYISKTCDEAELRARVGRAIDRARQARLALADRRTLRGDLAHVSLSSVLSFLEIERKTGVLLLVGDRAARVYVRAGRPVRADIEEASRDASSRELLAELRAWREGQFEFAVQDVPESDQHGNDL
jgi:uncharacterized protein (TIGR02266 family)